MRCQDAPKTVGMLRCPKVRDEGPIVLMMPEKHSSKTPPKNKTSRIFTPQKHDPRPGVAWASPSISIA